MNTPKHLKKFCTNSKSISGIIFRINLCHTTCRVMVNGTDLLTFTGHLHSGVRSMRARSFGELNKYLADKCEELKWQLSDSCDTSLHIAQGNAQILQQDVTASSKLSTAYDTPDNTQGDSSNFHIDTVPTVLSTSTLSTSTDANQATQITCRKDTTVPLTTWEGDTRLKVPGMRGRRKASCTSSIAGAVLNDETIPIVNDRQDGDDIVVIPDNEENRSDCSDQLKVKQSTTDYADVRNKERQLKK